MYILQLALFLFLMFFTINIIDYLTTESNTFQYRSNIWQIDSIRSREIPAQQSQNFYLTKKKINSLLLAPGTYRIGNTPNVDIYVDVTSQLITLDVSLDISSVYITVIKGELMFEGTIFKRNSVKQIEIPAGTSVFLRDIELKFERRKTL